MRRIETTVLPSGCIRPSVTEGSALRPGEPVTVIATADLSRLLAVVEAARHIDVIEGDCQDLDAALAALDAAGKEPKP